MNAMDQGSSLSTKSASIVTRKRRRISQRILNDEAWYDFASPSASQLKAVVVVNVDSTSVNITESESQSKCQVRYEARVQEALEDKRECLDHAR